MAVHKEAVIGQTLYFHFAFNNPSNGAAADISASASYIVRQAGDAAATAPVESGSPILLSHANYPGGNYEVTITATSTIYTWGNTYAVYATGEIGAVNPAGLIGSFELTPAQGAKSTVLRGYVDNTAFPATTVQMESDTITEATANHFKGRLIAFFNEGANTTNLHQQFTRITAYTLTGGRGHFTYEALTEAPADNDAFVIF